MARRLGVSMDQIETQYTTEEAAALLHVTQRTVYAYIKDGKLKANKTASDTWRIPASAINAFLGVEETAGKLNTSTLTA